MELIGLHWRVLARLLVILSSLWMLTGTPTYADHPNQVQIAFVPDLIQADRLAHFLDSKLRHRFQGLDEPHLQIQVIHYGKKTDFPDELAWVVNNLKNSFETDPEMPKQVDVGLEFVTQEQFRDALRQLEKSFEDNKELLLRRAEAASEQVEALTRHLEDFEAFARNLDESTQKLIAYIADRKTRSLQQYVQKIQVTIGKLKSTFEKLADPQIDVLPWKTMSSIEQQLLDQVSIVEQVAGDLLQLRDNSVQEKALLRKTIQDLRKVAEEAHHIFQIALNAQKIAMHLRYGRDPRERLKATPTPETWGELRQFWQQYFDQIKVSGRQIFGLPRGMTWIMYKLSFTERTPREHITEFTSAIIQSVLLFGITYFTLHEKALQGEALSVYGGASVAAFWKLLTGYVERANNAFFVQGINYSPMRQFFINRKFFLMSAYVHSIVISMTVQLAARGTEGLMMNNVEHTAWNSFLGLFAKALPLLLISKHQLKRQQVEDSESIGHSKWKTIALNFILGVTYQGLKAFHLFRWDFLNLDKAFVVLGLSGLGYEIYSSLVASEEKVSRWEAVMTNLQAQYVHFKRTGLPAGLQEPRTCETLLIVPRSEPRIMQSRG